MTRARRVAVIGGGWAGLSAAVEATRLGHAVTLFEMAPQWGGRAREVEVDGMALDNGQHILIGAYSATLALLREVGVDPQTALLRTPLCLVGPDGRGLRLRAGGAVPAFVAAVLRHDRWPWPAKCALLMAAGGWAARRFRCAAGVDVAQLTRRLPQSVRDELIDPLCVAALNTPAPQASGAVFLRVLRDALFSGAGSADLLLPRVSLGELLPVPATRWLERHGARLRLGQRVQQVVRCGSGTWQVDADVFDAVVLAAPPGEAARLARDAAPGWAARTAALRFEPIITVYLRSPGARLAAPMLALPAGPLAPAQFVFDRGQLGGAAGLLAFVVSGAQPWVDQGEAALLRATEQQARAELKLGGPLQVLRVVTEKRATFRCTPDLQRPAMQVAPGWHAAGDYVDGPYPATLEGAVRSGVAAVRAFKGSPDGVSAA